MNKLLATALACALAMPVSAQEGVVRQRPPPPEVKQPQLTKLPVLLQSQPAVYPPGALAQGLTSDVGTQLDIGADGRVARVEITASAGPEFDAAALAALAGFRFSPAEFDGVPAAVRIGYVYHFVLDRKKLITEIPAVDPDAGAIKGEVLEAGTRRAVPGSEVILGKVGLTAVANAEGRFTLADVPPGTHELFASAPGFAEGKLRIVIEKKGQAEATFYLRRTLVGELTATIIGEKAREAPTRRTLQREELQNVPGSLNDPIRAIQNLPGLARAPFLSGALIVRGANPADTGVYFDGARIPVLYHFLGGPSVINEELLDRIDFYPGGFGAYYGHNIAGAVDVKSHRGDDKGLHGSASVDLLQASAFVEGPVAEKTRVAVAARRSYIDVFLPLFLPNDPKNGITIVTPIYYDYQGRIDHKLSNGDDLALLVFGSDDKLALTRKGGTRNNDIAIDTHTGFHRLQLTWKREVSKDWSFSIAPVLGYTQQSFSAAGAGPGTFALPQSGRLVDWSGGLRAEARFKLHPSFELRAGLDLLHDRYNYEADIQSSLGVRSLGLPITEQLQFRRLQPFTQLGEYVEGELKLGKLSLTPGLRLDQVHWLGNSTLSADPRLWARYELTDETAVKGYVGLYHEPPSPLQVDPSVGNKLLGQPYAGQFGLGVEEKFGSLWNASAEVFYNRRADLIYRADATTRPDGTIYNPILDNTGIGRSFGLELLLRREVTANLYGSLAYTLSRSQVIRKPTEQWRASQFDQPHLFTLIAGWRPSPGWDLSTRYRLTSGNPTTPTVGSVFDSDSGSYVASLGNFGDSRLPVFSQLDGRAQYTWTYTLWQLSLYLDVQNVLNTKNEEIHLTDYRFREQGSVSGLPILPTLGIKGRF